MRRENVSAQQELAELIKANISGPVKQELIETAQRRLVERMFAVGAISVANADKLSV